MYTQYMVPFDKLRTFDSRLATWIRSGTVSPSSLARHERAQRVEWRRRESNENPETPNSYPSGNLQLEQPQLEAPGHRAGDTSSHYSFTPVVDDLSTELERVINAWPLLPPQTRKVILLLITS
jgi:hypothetical protein